MKRTKDRVLRYFSIKVLLEKEETPRRMRRGQ